MKDGCSIAAPNQWIPLVFLKRKEEERTERHAPEWQPGERRPSPGRPRVQQGRQAGPASIALPYPVVL